MYTGWEWLYVTPLNYSGIIEVESIIDGTIINFYDAPRFKVKHTYMTANEKLQQMDVMWKLQPEKIICM